MALFHVLICAAFMADDFNSPKLVPVKPTPQREQQIARAQKQILVYLTPSGVKVFTPNRPSQDKDLLDRVPPTNEVMIVCDGVEQSNIGGKPAWKCTGNVRLHATKVTAFCHEVTVTQDAEFLLFEISGGGDPDAVLPVSEEPTSPQGNALVMSERGSNEPYRFDGGVTFHAGQVKQQVATGAYIISIKSDSTSFKGNKI